jgi:hypothetical protein
MNRQNVVSVRFTDTEVEKLKDLAQKRGVCEGFLLRELVVNARTEPKKVVTWSISSTVEMAQQKAESAAIRQDSTVEASIQHAQA